MVALGMPAILAANTSVEQIVVAQSESTPAQSAPSRQPVIENPEPATNSIPPAATSIPAAALEIPAPAPQITAVPPQTPSLVPAPETPKAVVEVPPPPPLPPTPAETLKLAGKDRTKAEKCLANAVYFEARGEPVRGQIAVAQVVLNRVFSPYYPKDVCSVVYQNADHHLACQFTFACDGKSKATNERGAWWRAQRVAKQMLDGKVWIAAVAKSTHYHAYWVSPSWVAEMKKMFRYGVHTFYRPQRWGDGAQEAGWVQAPLPVLSPKQHPASNPPKPQATNVQSNPLPANNQASVASAAIPAKTLPANVQAKALPANTPAKTAPTSGQTKATPIIIQAKLSPANKQAKVLPANAQAKALPTSNVQKRSSSSTQTKPLPANSQAKPTQKQKVSSN